MNILRQAYIRYDNNHYVFEILDRGNNVHIKCVHHSSYLYILYIYLHILINIKALSLTMGKQRGNKGEGEDK